MNMHQGKISIAVVGAGGMGKLWAETIASHSRTRLASIIDIDAARRETLAQKYQVPSYNSLGETTSPFDAACIVVPHAYLAQTVQEALILGKHVLVEKPAARTPEELKKIMALAKEKNLRLMVGYNHRFDERMKTMKKLVDEGEIGDIMFIHGRFGASGRPGYEKEWRHSQKIGGGGAGIDMAVHLIDLARWFLGDFSEVKGLAENLFWNSEVEDNAFLLLKTNKGRIASLHASWSHWKPIFSFEIFGKDGYLVAEGVPQYLQEERLIVGKRPADFLGSHVVEKIMTFPEISRTSALKGEIDEFVNSIEEKREPSPNGNDALRVLQIINSLYQER